MTLAGYGYNPFGGGYGQPTPQMYAQQAAQQAYMQQAQGFGQMQQPVQMQQPNVTVRLVTNYNEADAAQIAFDNTINLFVNMAAGEIYVKRFNPNTGLAPIAVYRQDPPQAAQEAAKPQTEYATVEMVAALESRVSELAEAMNAKRKRTLASDE